MNTSTSFLLYWMLTGADPTMHYTLPQAVQCPDKVRCLEWAKALEGLKVPGTDMHFSVFTTEETITTSPVKP